MLTRIQTMKIQFRLFSDLTRFSNPLAQVVYTFQLSKIPASNFTISLSGPEQSLIDAAIMSSCYSAYLF